jgi:hypothetical protein
VRAFGERRIDALSVAPDALIQAHAGTIAVCARGGAATAIHPLVPRPPVN